MIHSNETPSGAAVQVVELLFVEVQAVFATPRSGAPMEGP